MAYNNPMKRFSKTVFRILCLILLFIAGMACAYGGTRLDSWRLWCGLKITLLDHQQTLLWAAVFALQAGVMKWTGAIWTVLFSLLSFLLLAWMVMLTAGQEAAVTSLLYEQMDAVQLGDVLSRYPVMLYLVPILWFMACLCAREQVRTFCTALICYGLWHALTTACLAGIQRWQAMEQPPCADILQNIACCPWLAAAIPGCFLLLYALLMAAGDAVFPRRKHARELTPAGHAPSHP